ncbi:unnamed protein product [Dovyalis caffra]|uniref:Uncharacterized protein n=1 Tax=Dovyalis caffra TaxID=77055 RepID=A0AAV1RUN9_9ROSI|nr:unnamed protein product [Dovyalis caffra]
MGIGNFSNEEGVEMVMVVVVTCNSMEEVVTHNSMEEEEMEGEMVVICSIWRRRWRGNEAMVVVTSSSMEVVVTRSSMEMVEEVAEIYYNMIDGRGAFNGGGDDWCRLVYNMVDTPHVLVVVVTCNSIQAYVSIALEDESCNGVEDAQHVLALMVACKMGVCRWFEDDKEVVERRRSSGATIYTVISPVQVGAFVRQARVSGIPIRTA